MLNINNGFHWCIVNFCMKQSWLNEMGPRAGRAQLQCALPYRWLPSALTLFISLLHRGLPCWRYSCLNGCWWSLGWGCRLLMSLPSQSPWFCSRACWQSAVEGVSNRGIGKQQQPWKQWEVGECPQFSGQSGRRLVVKREREKKGRGHLEWWLGSSVCSHMLYLLWHSLIWVEEA